MGGGYVLEGGGGYEIDRGAYEIDGPPKYLTEPLRSNIWGLYTPQIFDGTPSVKYLGAVHPPKNL